MRTGHQFSLFHLVVVLFCLTLLAGPSAKAQEVIGISLNTPQVWRYWKNEAPDGKDHFGAAAAMEFTRQAIFIAARDELGLLTSDESLGQPLEREGIVPFTLDLDMITLLGSETKLSRGDKVLIDRFIDHKWIVVDDHTKAAELYESLSRTEFLQALRDAGLKGQPNKWHDSAPVPDSIQALVDELSLVSQFRAARALHQLLRSDGESPERLWALSRVYANLGQECRWFIRCQYAVFQARSWLYAQRLSAKSPESPYGQLARAYAWTLAGYPGYSEPIIEQLQAQHAERQANAPAEDWDGWVELIDACNKYDRLRLDELMLAKDARSSVAAMWSAFTYEFVKMKGLTFGAIEKAMEVNPLSTRNLYSGYDAMGVSAGHWLTEAAPQHFGVVTAMQLSKIDAGPKAVLDVVSELNDERLSLKELAMLGWKLEDLAGEGKDPEELSYGVLGTLIGEANALHILCRAKFMRKQWGVDTGDYLRETAPAITRHPYRPLILTYLFKSKTSNDIVKNLMASFEPTYLNCYHVHMFSYHLPYRNVPFANGWDVNQWWYRVVNADYQAGCEYLYSVRWAGSDENELAKARTMTRFDFHHPKRIALLLEHQKRNKNFDKLVAEYGTHPLVADALADRMMKDGDLNEALGYARLAASAAPERKTLERLAEIELLQGDEVGWLAAMKAILKMPDHGLDHAKINQIIAHTYMNQGRFEEALPYSKASADSWAAWAMNTYMINLAVLGERNEAQAIGRRVNERYGQGYWAAENIQLWAGRADAEALTDAVGRYLRRQYGADSEDYAWRMQYLEMMLGQFDHAIERVEEGLKRGQSNTRMLLFGVVAAQYLGKTQTRDRLLDLLVKYPPEQDGKRLRFSLLADLMKQALVTGRMDWEAAAQWAKEHDAEGIEVAGNLGIFALKLEGERERGFAELLALAKGPKYGTNLTIIARTLLRREGYTNEQMLPTGFDGHAWPEKRGAQ